MVEPIDYEKRVRAGKVSMMEWAADFRNAKCTYYYNESDLEPYHEMCKAFEKFR